MTTASPEKVSPLSEQAEVESEASTETTTGGPMSPVPLAAQVGTPTVVRPEGAGADRTTDSPLGRLRRVDPASATPIQVAPKNLERLLACSDFYVRYLCADTKPDGKLMALLKGAFEADWFKAKACLVFDKWPGGAKPRFSHESSLELMTALTVLRGEVHKKVMPEAQKAVRAELATRAAQLKGNKKLGDRLDAEKGRAPAEQVVYKGAVGADTVTSDVDVSTGGANSEIAVRAYNATFRKLLDVTFDPGTVFDLNVYAMDFVHGKTDAADKKSFQVNAENAEDPGADNAAARDDEQDIWALVHVARYLPDDNEWAELVRSTVAGVANDAEKKRQQDLHDKARWRAKGFEARLVGMMVHLESAVFPALDDLERSSWGKDNQQYAKGALRMRAANKIYEDKLLQVKEIRSEIAELRTSGANPERLSYLVAELTNTLSMAQLYANEVYGSGGGTVHAVFGMQTKKKLETERGHKVKVEMSPAQWMETFTDNLGDVLKDFEHYGAHAAGGADYWYAAFKMGKYVDRMLDAIPNLADAGLIERADKEEIESLPIFTKLAALAENHRTEKDGPSKNDPQKLKVHPYFKTIDGPGLDALKKAALQLGVLVRTKAGNKRAPAPPTPEAVPPSAPLAPSGGGPGDGPSAVLASALAAVTKTGAELSSVEAEAEGP